MHKLHLINATLMLAVILLGFEAVAIPAQVMAYESASTFWMGLVLIVCVLAFSMYWKRLGRIGAVMVATWSVGICSGVGVQGDLSLGSGLYRLSCLHLTLDMLCNGIHR